MFCNVGDKLTGEKEYGKNIWSFISNQDLLNLKSYVHREFSLFLSLAKPENLGSEEQ